ncbi:MAG: GNAT family N-acetyltransferase [Exilibacterium sp.]
MSDIQIRYAKKEDLKTIQTLLRQLGYETEQSNIAPFVATLDPNQHDVFVGVSEGSVIALMSLIYFNYFPSGEKYCRITAIVVNEGLRGSGIGKRLIEHAKKEAKSKKCSALELTTSFRRENTQAFYEHIGFEKTSYKYVQKLITNV